MFIVDDQVFERIVAVAIDHIPERYSKHMNNVGFVVEDEPSPSQREKLHLHNGQTLYGLYEGIPLTKRGSGYNLVLPDKITIFKKPIEYTSHDLDSLTKQVQKTVWHEVAHHFGLDHERMDRLENK